jgi:hypothetical protein
VQKFLKIAQIRVLEHNVPSLLIEEHPIIGYQALDGVCLRLGSGVPVGLGLASGVTVRAIEGLHDVAMRVDGLYVVRYR